jgi:hypothetical protein
MYTDIYTARLCLHLPDELEPGEVVGRVIPPAQLQQPGPYLGILHTRPLLELGLQILAGQGVICYSQSVKSVSISFILCQKTEGKLTS